MPFSKVNNKYQVEIPAEVRKRANIEKGDAVQIEFDKKEGLVKLTPLKLEKRKTRKFGSKLTVEQIERGIEIGQSIK